MSVEKASHTVASNGNGLAPQRVSDIQRARMLAAMAEVACERGAANVTVAHVVEYAGVSRRTFYEIFTDSEDCFLAAVDEAAGRAAEAVMTAHRSATRWREQMRAGLTALLELLDEQPNAGRLLVVETLAAGRRALRRRTEALVPVIAAVDRGRGEVKAAPGPPPLAAESVVGAVLSVLHARLIEDHPRPLAELVNPLMSMIVLPYLGPAAARRELERPAPAATVHAQHTDANPLKALQMRLTYRTVRVLFAIAANRGASNRRIADAAGITDQGQVSKLLARLEKLGLIENGMAQVAGRGEPNAWTLTAGGEEVHRALAAQATHA